MGSSPFTTLLLVGVKGKSMKRRTLLIGLGTGGITTLTGCIENLSSASGITTTSAKQRTRPRETRSDAGEELLREVSLNDQDTVPSKYKIQIDVEIIKSTITETETARIRITTTNEGRERAISINKDPCDIFNRSRGGSDDPPGLWLYKSDDTENIDRKNGQWVPDESPDEPRGFPAYGCGRKVYEREESVSTEYAVWDDYQVEGYLEPGIYRWEEEVHVSKGSDSTDTADESFTWGFSIAVE